ncbi:alpha/beta fold hydrolase [Labrys sp. KNU-23]|uniref:alpha/beta fold hydrolase n=1 Tax=Labrys sp. KNU-23 TaxID=2789216 RepID=UPI00165C2371|nr:alpha/beta hydrolase [Labrys sp. KNU-23]
MTAPFVEIADGHRLFVRDWGRGDPVLLLAGWAMDSSVWAETMVELNAQGLRTIAYDRRGHGRSSDPGTVDFDALADDLAAVIRHLDLTDLTIVAHSCAAGEVLRYVGRHGAERIGRIVMVGAQGPCLPAGPGNEQGIPREAIEALMAELAGNLPAWLDANIGPFAPGADRRVLDRLIDGVFACSRRVLLDLQRVIMAADLRAEAAALRVPVTLIHGDRDASAPLNLTGRRYAALIPGADLLVYEGVAHGAMVTHAGRLARDIARIAARLAPLAA